MKRAVYTEVENEQGTPSLIRIGVATARPDGTLTLQLDALPRSGACVVALKKPRRGRK